MALSKDDILNAVAEMSVMDLVELISAFEEKFGVSAAAVAVAAGPAAGWPLLLLKSRLSSTLSSTSFGANKVGVIKVVREAPAWA
jgi:large subunit ribosomal protein L7/L12